MMRFESPLALLLLLFAPLLIERELWGAAQKLFLLALSRFSRVATKASLSRSSRVSAISALEFASPVALPTLPYSARARLRPIILSTLKVSAYALLVFALARPQLGLSFNKTDASARDIMLALDVSGSMQAMDFFIDGDRVTRIDALKHVIKQFVDERQDDRLGLVIFGGKVFTQCPLTLDKNVLHEYVDLLEVGMGGEGTAIGDALTVALRRMKKLPAQSKAIVLVTDGKNNAGKISPEQGARLAKQLGVKVHVIGIGSNDPAPIPQQGMFGQTVLVNAVMEYDEKTLKQIAETTGGEYFNARDTEKLQAVYQQINKLEERSDKAPQYTQYNERFFPLVLLALTFVLAAELLSSTILLRVP